MLKKVKELLDSGAISEETAKILDNEWKTEVKKLNDENKDLRLENETLSQNYEEIVKSKGDLDAQLATLDEKIKKAKEDGQKELQAELEAERQSKEDLQNSLENLKKANTNLRLDKEVSKAFADFDVVEHSKDAIEFMLRSRVSVNDKGDVIYKDGDQEFGLMDGLTAYFEANPNKLNAVGSREQGSGAGGQGASGGSKKGSFIGSSDERKSAIADMIANDK